MPLFDLLPSQTGENWKNANSRIAIACLDDPGLLPEVAEILRTSKDKKALGHCAEIMTMVSEEKPELVAPYADILIRLLGDKFNRARWESMHAISHIAHLVPDKITPLLEDFRMKIDHDKSIIVRDCAARAIADYAAAGKKYSLLAWPHLLFALRPQDNRFAHHAIPGLVHVANFIPSLKNEIIETIEEFADHKRGMIKKAARKALRELDM